MSHFKANLVPLKWLIAFARRLNRLRIITYTRELILRVVSTPFSVIGVVYTAGVLIFVALVVGSVITFLSFCRFI